MKDVEILLRGFAMLLFKDAYKPSLTKFLNTFSAKAKKFTQEEIQILENIFIEFAKYIAQVDNRAFFSKGGRFNISVYEAIFFALCEDAYKNKNTNIKPTTVENIALLKDDAVFIDATQSNTASTSNVVLRIDKAKTML